MLKKNQGLIQTNFDSGITILGTLNLGAQIRVFKMLIYMMYLLVQQYKLILYHCLTEKRP